MSSPAALSVNCLSSAPGAARLRALDAVRGLAAVTVMINHCLLTLPTFFAAQFHIASAAEPLPYIITHSPLHVFWAGYEAVILFFILSGFVLSLPYLSSETPPYRVFLVKRVCRIYLPYVAVIGSALILMRVFARPPEPQLSQWYNQMWRFPVSRGDAVSLALMLRDITHNVDTAAWSLYHEMRISLVFPLVALAACRLRWRWLLVLSLAVSLLGTVIAETVGDPYSIGMTIHYAAFFILGATLARYRADVIARLQQANRATLAGLAAVAACLYLWRWLFGVWLGWPPIVAQVVFDWAPALGASMAFVLVLASPNVSRFLFQPVFQWLGRISYSLYLVHALVLLVVLRTSSGSVPAVVALLATPFVALGVATLVHHALEAPAQRLGNRLGARLLTPTVLNARPPESVLSLRPAAIGLAEVLEVPQV